MNILIVGEAGYIGSHIATLIKKKAIIFDNFSNSTKNIINNFKALNFKNIVIIKVDIRDTNLLIKAIKQYKIDSVIHLVALKSVKEYF